MVPSARPYHSREPASPKVSGWAVMPELRLLSCMIDKNGVTLQTALVHVATNSTLAHARSIDTRTFWVGLRRVAEADILPLLKDTRWRSSLVWRDPVERWLSAYNSKCLLKDFDGHMHCHKWLGLSDGLPNAPTHTSVLAAQRNKTNDMHPCSWNSHWAPQHCSCGLDNLLRTANISHVIPFQSIAAGLQQFYEGRVPPALKGIMRRQMARVTLAPGWNAAKMAHRTHANLSQLNAGIQAEIRELYKEDYLFLRNMNAL